MQQGWLKFLFLVDAFYNVQLLFRVQPLPPLFFHLALTMYLSLILKTHNLEPQYLIEKYDAVKFAKLGSEIIGGKGGGGRKDFAQAGGTDPGKIDGLPPKELRKLVDKGKKDLGEGIVVVFANKDDKVGLAVGVTDKLANKFDAVKFVKVGSEIIGGKGGGGRKDFAQAGGQDQSKIEEAFEKLKSLI